VTSILSVDLACKRHADIGVMLLERRRKAIRARRILPFPEGETPTAPAVAQVLAECAGRFGAGVIIMDGSQAWKASDNGLRYARRCEAELATQGKTGLPGQCTPSTYLRFLQFSISVFDELAARGWMRLASMNESRPGEKLILESFPTGAWRSLGLKPLPGKRSATESIIRLKQAELESLFDLRVGISLTHDELQALVAGFAAVAVAESRRHEYRCFGAPPVLEDGTWREGFIVNPVVSSVCF
jgi:hypothetical protein